MTDERFLQLHSQYMNRHYRTALYLLGNREAAAAAAEQSWLHCCLGSTDETTDEAFQQSLCRTLFSLCQPQLETLPFQPEALLPNGRGNRQAAASIGGLPIPQRLALILVSVGHCTPELTADLLSLPLDDLHMLLKLATAAVFGQEKVSIQ